MMLRNCNRRCWTSDSRKWFTPILRSSISRHQEGKCSGSSRATPCKAGNRRQKGARGMAQKAFSMQPCEAKRVRVESARSFDEVLLNLCKEVGTATLQEGNV